MKASTENFQIPPPSNHPRPEHWKWTPLEELCIGIYDCPHSTPDIKLKGPLVARTQDITSGVFDEKKAAHVSEETYQERTKRATPTWGDIFYSREGTYFGIAAEVPRDERVCLGQRMTLIRTKPDIASHRFIRYWLNSPTMRTYVKGLHSGSVAQRLNLSTIKKLPILTPPLREQDSISEILGALDDKIAANERITHTSRQLGLALYKKSIAPEPTSTTIENISEYLNRGQAPKYTDDDDGTLIINQRCIRSGRVQLEPARQTSPARVQEARFLKTGDVLVNSTGVGTLGRVAIWSHKRTATVDSHVTIVRIDSKITPTVVGGYAMLAAQPQIEALGEGSTGQTELSKAKLGKFEIQIPPSGCDVLATRLSSLEEKTDSVLSESRTLANLRDTLLPQLMSGKLRVKDAERVVEDTV